MKQSIFILTILLSGLILNSQTDSISEKEYLLKGKLISEFDRITFACGVLAIATVVEFEIIEFTNTDYKEKKIPVIFTCPGSGHRDLFKVGKIYELILASGTHDVSKWSFLEGRKEILSRYGLERPYWFIETKWRRKDRVN